MSISNAPESLQSHEAREVVRNVASFEQYRELCDSTGAFRRLGLLDKEAYVRAVEDPRTVFSLVDGRHVPIVAPLRYEQRYNALRSEQMARSEVLLLTIPLSLADTNIFAIENLYGGEIYDDEAVILIEEVQDEEAARWDRESALDALSAFGKRRPKDFFDDRPANPDNKTAWMAMYDFAVVSEHNISEDMLGQPIERAFLSAWKSLQAETGIADIPGPDSNDTHLLSAEQLKANPRIINDLWSISQSGFGDVLGKNHPIAMEVTKAFFDEHIMSEGVFTVAKYQNGVPVCFGFFAPSLDHNPWLNERSKAVMDEIAIAQKNNEQIGHFFELISNSSRGVALSSSVLNIFLEVAARARPEWRILFESTNFSDGYIPRLVELSVKRSSGTYFKQEVKRRTRLHYWYAEKGTNTGNNDNLALQ